MKSIHVMVMLVTAAGVTLMPLASADNPSGMSFFRQLPGEYAAGTAFDVGITVTCSNGIGVTALTLYETVPDGWTFVNMTGTAPQTSPVGGDSGTLVFSWTTIPAFPFSLSYRLNVPAGAAGIKAFSGTIEYQMNGGMFLSAETPSSIDASPGMVLSRQFSGGYTPGNNLEVRLTLNCTGEAGAIRALGLYETVPSGWTFVSVREITGPKPAIYPAVGNSGLLEFAWIAVPAFPYTFAYAVKAPSNAQGQNSFSGQAEYRLSGAAVRTAPVITAIAPALLLEDVEALRDGFTQADLNANGTLNFEEASAFIEGLAQEQFNQLDTDGDGALTLAELNAYIEANTPGSGCNCGKAAVFSKDWLKHSLGDLFLAGLSLFILAAGAKMGRRDH